MTEHEKYEHIKLSVARIAGRQKKLKQAKVTRNQELSKVYELMKERKLYHENRHYIPLRCFKDARKIVHKLAEIDRKINLNKSTLLRLAIRLELIKTIHSLRQFDFKDNGG